MNYGPGYTFSRFIGKMPILTWHMDQTPEGAKMDTDIAILELSVRPDFPLFVIRSPEWSRDPHLMLSVADTSDGRLRYSHQTATEIARVCLLETTHIVLSRHMVDIGHYRKDHPVPVEEIKQLFRGE